MNNTEITALLRRWREGEREAGNRVLELVYDELRRLAAREFRRERKGHTLQPTALAHEAYVRMIEGGGMPASDRGHFLGMVARVVRQVLVDHGRKHRRQKRYGGERIPVELAEDIAISEGAPDLVDLDRALTELGKEDEETARVVELRCFGGLTVHETAAEMGLAVATVSRKWKLARAWLFSRLSSPSGE